MYFFTFKWKFINDVVHLNKSNIAFLEANLRFLKNFLWEFYPGMKPLWMQLNIQGHYALKSADYFWVLVMWKE